MDTDCTCPHLIAVYDDLMALSGQLVKLGYLCPRCGWLVTFDDE